MRAPTMPRVAIGFGELPSELGTAIFDKVKTSAAEEARLANPALTPEQAATASARALARLPAVSKVFMDWHARTLEAHPDVAMASTWSAIRTMARKPDEEFQACFDRQLAKNTHIQIKALPPSKLRIVLQSLAEHTETPLDRVNLDFAHPLGRGVNEIRLALLGEMVNAVAEMVRNHPEIRIDVSLSNRSLGAASAMHVAALLCNGVSGLDISHNRLNRECIALIGRALPGSRVTDLNLGFNDISRANSFIEALAGSNVRSLNLQANKLEPEDGESLGRVMPGCELRSLDVSMNTYLHAEGVRYILDALPGSEVTRVNLMGTIMLSLDGALLRSISDALLRSEVIDMDLTNNLLEQQDEQAIGTARAEAERLRSREIRVATGFVLR